MTLIEVAEVILGKSKDLCMSAREITDQAIMDGLIKPKSSRPWVHLQSAMRKRNRELIESGRKEKFALTEGKWRLN